MIHAQSGEEKANDTEHVSPGCEGGAAITMMFLGGGEPVEEDAQGEVDTNGEHGLDQEGVGQDPFGL